MATAIEQEWMRPQMHTSESHSHSGLPDPREEDVEKTIRVSGVQHNGNTMKAAQPTVISCGAVSIRYDAMVSSWEEYHVATPATTPPGS